MEWFALLIPLLITGGLFLIFKETFTWWEVSLPTISTIIIILILKLIIVTGKTTDTEYWGSIIVEAKYYEYWETWVERECSYTTTCCCDANGQNCQTTTHYYDCSYCDENDAYWIAIDNYGREFSISESYYNYLKKKWSAVPEFVELGRDIEYHKSLFGDKCGKDGDMYKIKWDKKIETSEAAVTKHDYINRIQSSKSAFKFENISKNEVLKYKLYDYPKTYDYYKQKVILGLDSLPQYNKSDRTKIETYFQYLNGHRGGINKVKIFICLFFDQPLSVVKKQQAYWDGANQNEIVICIGLNKGTQEINWVEAFSFTNEKRVLVDLREDISNLKVLQLYEIYNIINQSIDNKVIYRDYDKDFNYLKVELTNGNITLIYIISFIITIAVCYICITNESGNYGRGEYWNYSHKDKWKLFIHKLMKK